MVYDKNFLDDNMMLRAYIEGRNEGIRDTLQFVDNWVKQYDQMPRPETIYCYLKASIIEVDKHD